MTILATFETFDQSDEKTWHETIFDKDALSRGCRYKPGKQHSVLKKHSVVQKASSSKNQEERVETGKDRGDPPPQVKNRTMQTSKDGRTAKCTEVTYEKKGIAKKVTQEGTQLNIERIANAVPVNMKVRFRQFYMKFREHLL